MTSSFSAKKATDTDAMTDVAAVVAELRALINQKAAANAKGWAGEVQAIDRQIAKKVPTLLSHIEQGRSDRVAKLEEEVKRLKHALKIEQRKHAKLRQEANHG